jgi:LysM repeat protein
MMQKITILTLLLASGLLASAQPDLKKFTIEQYIEKYASLAQNEMALYGIPASITLAQGILESNYGNSELTTKAKNHFGIKCHNGWTGKGYYMDDDTKQECFRVYDTDAESYRDHSDFLKTRERYAFLFELESTDYKSWAKGLLRAGYATNPQYANLLIRIIEERNLARFDTKKPVDTQVDYSDPNKVLDMIPNEIFLFNNIKTVIVKQGHDIPALAELYHMNVRQLTKYNDIDADAVLTPGQKIYLQPKRSKGFNKFHVVNAGETMHYISQKEGIKMSALYKKNQMVPGEEPLVGERLCLHRKCKDKPKTYSEEELLTEKNLELDKHIEQVKKDRKKEIADSLAIVNKDLPKNDYGYKGPPYYHTLLAGETMYSVSKKYGVAISDVETWNKMKSGAKLSVGQSLIVGFGDVKPIELPKMPEPINPEIFGDDTTIYKPTPTPAPTPTPTAADTNKVSTITDAVVPETDLDPTVRSNDTDEPNNILAYPEYHIVEGGESMYSIAKKYDVTVEKIKEWNNLPDYTVTVGQRLMVYDNTTTVVEEVPLDTEIENNKRDEAVIYHTVLAGETLYGVARLYNVSVNDVRKWNPGISDMLKTGQKLIIGKVDKPSAPDEEDAPKPKPTQPPTTTQPEKPKPTQPITPKTTGTQYHTVEPNQTLYGISRLYNVTVEKLTEWNKLSSTSINVGQKLIVSP